MRTLVYFVTALLLVSCSQSEDETLKSGEKEVAETTVKQDLNAWSMKVIRVEERGWGYQLFQGSNLKINQRNIPAVSGLHYFTSEQKATIAANFALQKIEAGAFPPTVSPEELDSLGAINLDSLNSLNQ
jgi:hypothetical protein